MKNKHIIFILVLLGVPLLLFFLRDKKSEETRRSQVFQLVLYRALLKAYADNEEPKLTFPDSGRVKTRMKKGDKLLYKLVNSVPSDSFSLVDAVIETNYKLDITPDVLGMIIRIQDKVNGLPKWMKVKEDLYLLNEYIRELISKNTPRGGYGKNDPCNLNDQKFADEWGTCLDSLFGQKILVDLAGVDAYNAGGYSERLDELPDEIDDRVNFDTINNILRRHFNDKFESAKKYSQLLRNWNAVVLFIHKDNLDSLNDEYMAVTAKPLHQHRRISDKVKFGDEYIIPSYGSGFFVSKDSIVTAAHVVCSLNGSFKLSDLRIIHQYHHPAIPIAETDRIKISKEYIYQPKAVDIIEDYWLTSDRADWAVLGVERIDTAKDKNYKDPVPVVMKLKEHVKFGESVYCIGHGLGLPAKLSFDGHISENATKFPYFQCRLDLFSGNSGSPIFDAATNRVVGIVVRGEEDFYQSSILPRGEGIYANSSNLNEYEEEPKILRPITYNLNDHFRGEHIQRLTPLKKVMKHKFNAVETSSRLTRVVGKKRSDAPYVYLNFQPSSRRYTLYILSHMRDNSKSIELDTSTQFNGTYYYKYNIVDSVSGVDRIGEYAYTSHVLPDTDTIKPEEWEAQVQIYGDTIMTSILSLINTDSIEQLDSNYPRLALMSPYSYLRDPAEDGQNIDFPFVFIPIENYWLKKESVSSTSDNFCNAFITLEESDSSLQILIPPNVNSHHYVGTNNYEFFVELEYPPSRLLNKYIDLSTIRRKKVKTKNKHADRKPNKVKVRKLTGS